MKRSILITILGIFFIYGCKTQKEISKPAEEGQTASINTGTQPAGSDNVLKDTAKSPENMMDSILNGYVVHHSLGGMFYSYKKVDTIPDILKKVFPGVQFVKCTQGVGYSAIVYTTIYNNEFFGSFGYFNKLAAAVGTLQMDLQDKALALILLFEGIEKSVKIDEVIADPQYSSKINCHPNYKIRAFVDNREVSYYLEVMDGKFINLVRQSGNFYSICMQLIQ